MARAKAGDSIRGYKILREFKMAGGGNCEWTFATKDGEEYFIKRFLNPKFPRPDGPGSEEIKRKLRIECEQFDKHQRQLNEKVKEIAGADGRLVFSSDFFLDDNLYYKVAKKVVEAGIKAPEISGLPLSVKISLLQNVTTAVSSLHRVKIVHGDLKFDNALLEKKSKLEYIARLIDFDSSYFSEKPPSVEEIMGDPPYYSPELLNYVQRRDEDPSKLNLKSDIFALGIVFHQYLSGKIPDFKGDHQYLSEAVRSGFVVSPDSLGVVGSPSLSALICSMMHLDPEKRPSAFEVQNTLKMIREDPAGIKLKTPEDPKPIKPDDEPDRGLVGPGSTPPATGKIEAKPKLRGTGVDPKVAKTPIEVTAPKTEAVKEELKISRPESDISTPAVEASPPSSIASKPKPDFELPKQFKITLEKLIETLADIDSEVEAKKKPAKVSSRIKGSLVNAPLNLGSDAEGLLGDVNLRIEDLQRHLEGVAAWFKGASEEMPALRIAIADFDVEAISTEDLASVEEVPSDSKPISEELIYEVAPDLVSEVNIDIEVSGEVDAPKMSVAKSLAEALDVSDSGAAKRGDDAGGIIDPSGSTRRRERLMRLELNRED